MTSDLIGIVYCTSSMRALRTIDPDDDKYLETLTLNPGESLVTIPRVELNGRHSLDHTIPVISKHAKIDVLPPIRCVVADSNGLVVDTGMYEPDLHVIDQEKVHINAVAKMTDKLTSDVQLVSQLRISAPTNNIIPEPVLKEPVGPYKMIPHTAAIIGDVLLEDGSVVRDDVVSNVMTDVVNDIEVWLKGSILQN